MRKVVETLKSVCVDVRTEGGMKVGKDVDGVRGSLRSIGRMRDEGRGSEGEHKDNWDRDNTMGHGGSVCTAFESRFVWE